MRPLQARPASAIQPSYRCLDCSSYLYYAGPWSAPSNSFSQGGVDTASTCFLEVLSLTNRNCDLPPAAPGYYAAPPAGPQLRIDLGGRDEGRYSLWLVCALSASGRWSNASTRSEIETAFATLLRDRSDAPYVAGDVFFTSRRVHLERLQSLRCSAAPRLGYGATSRVRDLTFWA